MSGERLHVNAEREGGIVMIRGLAPGAIHDVYLDGAPLAVIFVPLEPAPCAHDAWESTGAGRRCADCREWLGAAPKVESRDERTDRGAEIRVEPEYCHAPGPGGPYRRCFKPAGHSGNHAANGYAWAAEA